MKEDDNILICPVCKGEQELVLVKEPDGVNLQYFDAFDKHIGGPPNVNFMLTNDDALKIAKFLNDSIKGDRTDE